MKLKAYIKISIITFILGIMLLILGISVYISDHGVGNNYTNTVGTVISISEYDKGKVATTVRYKVENKTFTTILDYYDNTLKAGDKINISYSNITPSTIKYVDKHTYLFLGLIITGMCLIGTSIILRFRLIISKDSIKNEVMLTGRVKEGIKTLDKLGVYYAIVEVENPLNHKVTELRSKQSKSIEYKVGQEVKIQFDTKTNNMEII